MAEFFHTEVHQFDQHFRILTLGAYTVNLGKARCKITLVIAGSCSVRNGSCRNVCFRSALHCTGHGNHAAPHRCKPDTTASCTCFFKDRVAVHRDKISGDGAVLVHLLKSRQGFLGFLGIFSTPYNLAVSVIHESHGIRAGIETEAFEETFQRSDGFCQDFHAVHSQTVCIVLSVSVRIILRKGSCHFFQLLDRCRHL